MSPQTVVVVHREVMVAEGLAAALSRNTGILPIAIATTAEEGERCATRARAVAIDEQLDGARLAASRLRRRGIRVVFIGEGSEEDQGVTVSPRSSVAALASALSPRAEQPAERPLTPREEEVLSLVARGFAAKQVASHLGISPKTVEQHKTRIFAKLGVSNQTAAACLVLSTNLESAKPWIPSST